MLLKWKGLTLYALGPCSSEELKFVGINLLLFLRKYIYAEIPTKNPAIALQWALDWKETGSIYIIGAACITISMWTCWHMSSKTMDVYPEKNFFWGIYPMCKMRSTNFSGRRPT